MARDLDIVSRRGRPRRGALSAGILVYVFLFARCPPRGIQLQRQPVRHLPDHRWDDQVVRQVFHDYQIRDALTTTIPHRAQSHRVSTIVGTAAAFRSSAHACFPQRHPDRHGPTDHDSRPYSSV